MCKAIELFSHPDFQKFLNEYAYGKLQLGFNPDSARFELSIDLQCKSFPKPIPLFAFREDEPNGKENWFGLLTYTAREALKVLRDTVHTLVDNIFIGFMTTRLVLNGILDSKSADVSFNCSDSRTVSVFDYFFAWKREHDKPIIRSFSHLIPFVTASVLETLPYRLKSMSILLRYNQLNPDVDRLWQQTGEIELLWKNEPK